MRHAGMIGKFFQQWIENGDGFVPVGRAVNVLVRERHQRKRVERADFAVSGIFCVELLKRRGIGLDAVGMGQFGFVCEERGGRGNKALLARAGGVNLLRPFNFFAAFFQFPFVRELPNLVVQAHGLAPMRHGALGLARGHIREGLLRFLVLEGVQQRETFFERGLHVARARRGKIHFAKLVRRRRRHAGNTYNGERCQGEKNE